jgi:hypothetical protein
MREGAMRFRPGLEPLLWRKPELCSLIPLTFTLPNFDTKVGVGSINKLKTLAPWHTFLYLFDGFRHVLTRIVVP